MVAKQQQNKQEQVVYIYCKLMVANRYSKEDIYPSSQLLNISQSSYSSSSFGVFEEPIWFSSASEGNIFGASSVLPWVSLHMVLASILFSSWLFPRVKTCTNRGYQNGGAHYSMFNCKRIGKAINANVENNFVKQCRYR